jgi:hypothetical protein
MRNDMLEADEKEVLRHVTKKTLNCIVRKPELRI